MNDERDSHDLIESLLQSCIALDLMAGDVCVNFAEMTPHPRVTALFEVSVIPCG